MPANLRLCNAKCGHFHIVEYLLKQTGGVNPSLETQTEMMPIVDAYVQLSHDKFQLGDYLDQINACHILRLVAVQQPQSAEQALHEIQHLHELSNTRGYGGFPNVIVAYCDLTQIDSLTKLLDHEIAANIRGVHYAPTMGSSLSWVQDLEPLQSQGLTLELTLKAEQCNLVDVIATKYPELVIIINVIDWSAWLDIDTSVNDRSVNSVVQMQLLAKHENIHIKIGGCLRSDSSNTTELLNQLIERSVSRLGYERIMFSTGPRDNDTVQPFDDLWCSYMDATSSFTARQREKLFRSNAVRVYQL